ncbi:hypothetical protein Tco_0581962 [Tanacetum coccineum]
MNQNFYNSNASGFDQFQPPQLPVVHQFPQEMSKEILQAKENLMETIQTFLKKFDHIPPEEKPMAFLLAEDTFLKIKQAIEEEQNQPGDIQELMLKLLNDLKICDGILLKQEEQSFPMIDDDDNDDDEHTILYRSSKAITPDLPTEEPDNSLSMGDEYLSTIPETESDEVIKSSVENLVPIPSESEVTSDNENTLIDSSPKFYYLLEEFSGELAHIDPIPPGIEKVDFDLEKEIRLVENLSYDNSSPRPPEELNAEIADTILEPPSPSPIPVEDSDSHMEEIDLFLATDGSMPPGIKNDDYDSEGDIRFLEELLSNDSP